jgi:hypothetical protein
MKNESFYRKWIGVCTKSKVRPLILTFEDTTNDIVISCKGKELLKIDKDAFDKLSANEVLEIIGAIE